MLFTSVEFLLVFMPVVFGVNYLLPRKGRNVWLVCCSLIFYAWGEPVFVLVMLGMIGVNYALALCMGRWPRRKKALLTCTLICDLSVLLVFKYLNFLTENLHRLFPFSVSLFPATRIALPIGISFFTFQAMSYIIDVYRGMEPQRNPILLGLYVSLFPQLIAGPIVGYGNSREQVKQRKVLFSSFSEGVTLFLRGFNKKVLLANVLAEVADAAFGAHGNSVCMAWFGAFCYSLQIYYDFSGYSDMAIGLGRMLGFQFPRNFDTPYASGTISEFWRRWHITLGSWFRDYVYIPMGGSRVSSRAKLIRNLAVVWLLTGVWHGAEWTFILWGAFHGVLIILEKMTDLPGRLKKGGVSARGAWRIFTLGMVVLGWVLFRAENLPRAGMYLRDLFGMNGNAWMDDVFRFTFREYLTVFATGMLFSLPLGRWIRKISDRRGWRRLAALGEGAESLLQLILFVISVSCLVMSAHNPFIYFNF